MRANKLIIGQHPLFQSVEAAYEYLLENGIVPREKACQACGDNAFLKVRKRNENKQLVLDEGEEM